MLATGGYMRILISLSVLIIVAAGFILYLLRLNRRAKKEQSEVDPKKLRPWGDD